MKTLIYYGNYNFAIISTIINIIENNIFIIKLEACSNKEAKYNNKIFAYYTLEGRLD